MGQNGNFSENGKKQTQHTHARQQTEQEQSSVRFDLFQDLRFERECMRPFGPSDFHDKIKGENIQLKKKRGRKGLIKVQSFAFLPCRALTAYMVVFNQRSSKGGQSATFMPIRATNFLVFLLLINSSFFLGVQSFEKAAHPLRKLTANRARISLNLAPKQYPSLKMTPALKLVSTLLVALASATVYWNTGRQFETVESIPNQYFKEKKTIEGEVVRVTDGDTIR
jgi:hypothetical protein